MQTNETKRLFIANPTVNILQASRVTHYKQNVLAILNSVLIYSTFTFNELLVKNDVGYIKRTSNAHNIPYSFL